MDKNILAGSDFLNLQGCFLFCRFTLCDHFSILIKFIESLRQVIN